MKDKSKTIFIFLKCFLFVSLLFMKILQGNKISYCKDAAKKISGGIPIDRLYLQLSHLAIYANSLYGSLV